MLCDVDVYTMPGRAGMVVCCAWIWEGRACVLVCYPGQESVGVKVRWEGDVCARLTPALPRIHVPPPLTWTPCHVCRSVISPLLDPCPCCLQCIMPWLRVQLICPNCRKHILLK